MAFKCFKKIISKKNLWQLFIIEVIFIFIQITNPIIPQALF